MKTLLLMLSVIFTFLCTFSSSTFVENNNNAVEFSARKACNKEDSVVSIFTSDESIDTSGVVIANNVREYYIATSYLIYKPRTVYKALFSDGSILDASVLGYSDENNILILKVISPGKEYCVANIKDNDKMYAAQEVNLIRRVQGIIKEQKEYITYVGACRNCDEETFKRYYYSKISLDDIEEKNNIGFGVFSNDNTLLGIISEKLDKDRFAYAIIDSNKIMDILRKLRSNEEYMPNFIRHDLLNISDLSLEDRYLYSLSDNVHAGVLVSSINYMNLFVFGLNQGMVILQVEENNVYNCYDFDYELSKYQKGSYVHLKVLTIVGLYRSIVVKI